MELLILLTSLRWQDIEGIRKQKDKLHKIQSYTHFHFSQTNQSNNLEYTILAKASLLTAAAFGSRHLVIASSRVTITRLHNESSRGFSSHLEVLQDFGVSIKSHHKVSNLNITLLSKNRIKWLTWGALLQSLNGTETARPQVQKNLFHFLWQT